ncbi:hypothetical protein ABZ832_29515 [Streptantibioticus parmotrematis]|uniref:hypothetical protein n=1 Tax=Streptantibioticus parmotrematis TaxID=2873249 RepID=UPI0033CF7283
MPTPHGTRGGMAFSADELRVLRRALADALRTAATTTTAADRRAPDALAFPAPARDAAAPFPPIPAPAREPGTAREYRGLAAALDEAVREGARLRAFLLADLALYRDALPGTAADYLERLAEALDAGYLPAQDDLDALRSLERLPCGEAEAYRRDGLRRRCEELTGRPRSVPLGEGQPADRARLLTVPGGRVVRPAGPGALDVLIPVPASGATARGARAGDPVPPGPAPEPEPDPDRRVPTPAELWPPRRRGAPEPGERTARHAVGH